MRTRHDAKRDKGLTASICHVFQEGNPLFLTFCICSDAGTKMQLINAKTDKKARRSRGRRRRTRVSDEGEASMTTGIKVSFGEALRVLGPHLRPAQTPEHKNRAAGWEKDSSSVQVCVERVRARVCDLTDPCLRRQTEFGGMVPEPQ